MHPGILATQFQERNSFALLSPCSIQDMCVSCPPLSLHRQKMRGAHHNEVPHARSLSDQGGNAAASWHKDDLDGVIVEELVQEFGGHTRFTLQGFGEVDKSHPKDSNVSLISPDSTHFSLRANPLFLPPASY